MTTLRKRAIRLAQENPHLRKDLLPLLRVAYMNVGEALRSKKISLRDLDPTPGKKANMHFYKKIRRWRVQQANKVLKDAGVPQEHIDKFLEDYANGYSIDMHERDRSKQWAAREDDLYKDLVDPKTATMWKQLKSWIKSYGPGALDLADEAEGLLKGKSDIAIVVAGIKAGIISKYDVKKMVDTIKEVQGRNEEQLELLVEALKM